MQHQSQQKPRQYQRLVLVVLRRCLRQRMRHLRRRAWAMLFALLRPQWIYKAFTLLKFWPGLAKALQRARDYAHKKSKPFVFVKKLNISAEQIASFRNSRAITPPPMRSRQLGEDPERGRGQIKAQNPELHAQVLQGISAKREGFRSAPAPAKKNQRNSGRSKRPLSSSPGRVRSFDEARKK